MRTFEVTMIRISRSTRRLRTLIFPQIVGGHDKHYGRSGQSALLDNQYLTAACDEESYETDEDHIKMLNASMMCLYKAKVKQTGKKSVFSQIKKYLRRKLN